MHCLDEMAWTWKYLVWTVFLKKICVNMNVRFWVMPRWMQRSPAQTTPRNNLFPIVGKALAPAITSRNHFRNWWLQRPLLSPQRRWWLLQQLLPPVRMLRVMYLQAQQCLQRYRDKLHQRSVYLRQSWRECLLLRYCQRLFLRHQRHWHIHYRQWQGLLLPMHPHQPTQSCQGRHLDMDVLCLQEAHYHSICIIIIY